MDNTKVGVIENIVMGTKGGACTEGGDSGGPVYTFEPDGYVVAKGIHHSDSDPLFGDCTERFTDIHNVRQAYGGDVMKRR
ncbi:hypothetical protein ACFSKW_52120 [Nonomuraea mangrovi]|uniref:Peptidase S1 domain-containing protein n=1 Tax=Nonomuraea mangrovi TaxID=2316207 RepID=A0ABW4TFV2_9ACTN